MNYKFRGKTADNKWVYGFYVEGLSSYSEEKKHCIVQVGDNIGEFTEFINVLSETVGQWTGQKDKNGNDGFCGDLVKHKDGTIYQIVFNTELASFCLKFSFGRSCCFNSFDRLNKLSAYDIIGNIHDNPELLEDK